MVLPNPMALKSCCRELRKVTQNLLLRNRSGNPAGLQEVWGRVKEASHSCLLGLEPPPATAPGLVPAFFTFSGLSADKIRFSLIFKEFAVQWGGRGK